jgi:hypothetical protein
MTRPCKLICTKTIIDWHCLINKADIHNIVMSSAVLLFYIVVIVLALSLSIFLVSVRLSCSWWRNRRIVLLNYSLKLLVPLVIVRHTHIHIYTYHTHTHIRSHILHLFKSPGLFYLCLNRVMTSAMALSLTVITRNGCVYIIAKRSERYFDGCSTSTYIYTYKYNIYNAQPVCIKTRECNSNNI